MVDVFEHCTLAGLAADPLQAPGPAGLHGRPHDPPVKSKAPESGKLDKNFEGTPSCSGFFLQ